MKRRGFVGMLALIPFLRPKLVEVPPRPAQNFGGLASSGSLGRGVRPPVKSDWDAMSNEERNVLGLPGWDEYKKAVTEWREHLVATRWSRLP